MAVFWGGAAPCPLCPRSPALSSHPAQLRRPLGLAAVGGRTAEPRRALADKREAPGPKRCGTKAESSGAPSAARRPYGGCRDLAVLRPLPSAASFGPRFIPRCGPASRCPGMALSSPPGSGHTAARPRSVSGPAAPLSRRPALLAPPPPTEARVPLKARGGCAGRFMNGAT